MPLVAAGCLGSLHAPGCMQWALTLALLVHRCMNCGSGRQTCQMTTWWCSWVRTAGLWEQPPMLMNVGYSDGGRPPCEATSRLLRAAPVSRMVADAALAPQAT